MKCYRSDVEKKRTWVLDGKLVTEIDEGDHYLIIMSDGVSARVPKESECKRRCGRDKPCEYSLACLANDLIPLNIARMRRQ